jgi:hypothetical protein
LRASPSSGSPGRLGTSWSSTPTTRTPRPSLDSYTSSHPPLVS